MKFFLLFIALIPSFLFAQIIEMEKEEQKKMEFSGVFKSSISLELGGKSGYVGLSYDLLLTKNIRLGIGAGFPGVGADLKYYPFGVMRDKVLFNVGLRANGIFPLSSTDYMFYSVPLGLSLFTANRVNLEIDAGPLFKRPFPNAEVLHGFGNDLNYVWFSVKVGYRFSFYAIKRARGLKE